MANTARCYIALGSNLDNPQAQVQQAIAELAMLNNSSLVKQSSLYSSKPVGPQNQPDFINAVVSLDTQLHPIALLNALQNLETKHHRVRKQHWGARTLDLDILLYADQIISSERLTVPHPYICERPFVIWPLAEIAPTLILPTGKKLQQLLISQPIGSMQRLRL